MTGWGQGEFDFSCGESGDHLSGPVRGRPLWDDYDIMCDFERLYHAHEAARRGKQNKRDVVAFEMNLAENLCHLRDELKHRTYHPRPYHRFVVLDPKRRDIEAPAYRDRVVQHCLCDEILRPALDPRLVYDNAACRIGKGTHFALDRVSRFLREHHRRHGAAGYILKFDVRHYFASIDHEILQERLRKVFRSPDLLALLGTIIQSSASVSGKGLALGNQASQWFALYYLDAVDRLVKEELRVRHYSRYMDDGVLIHPSRDYLKACLDRIVEQAALLKIEMNDKTQIAPISQGIKYLGFHLYLTDSGMVVRKVNRSTAIRMRRCLAAVAARYSHGDANVYDVQQRVNSYVAHLSHGNTYALRRDILARAAFARLSSTDSPT
ncbi:MAG: reverse transcriptase domain-containing protein [Micrococcales bacterium]|nr:reverse transcriptase domain-containing protein [Micrococcales bacterium]MCL2668165.1 reverse transcriptase domain-containing protein [Micrococcales bacterium]